MSAEAARRGGSGAARAVRRREQFVQANYRFAVDPCYEGGYDVCMALPDAILDWGAVDVVFVDAGGDVEECPICLHGLRCPKITPCGHAFDHVCVLQHLSYGDGKTAKCPLCSSFFRASDLKDVAFRAVDTLNIGHACTMTLVSRARGSMVAVEHVPDVRHEGVPSEITAESHFFARFVFAANEYLLDLLTSSANDLREILVEDPSLLPFVDVAMAQIKDRRFVIRRRRTTARREAAAASAALQEGSSSANPAVCAPRPQDANGGSPTAEKPASKELRFFYQASDARNLFLHPFNNRCLTTEFGGNFNNALLQIEGKLVQVERHTMDDSLRRRYRFLDHLPDGCEFAFVELALSDLLSSATVAAHADELKEREAIRKRKQKETEREDRKLERQRTESLQEYFSNQAGHGRLIRQNSEAVDSSDVRLFPALGVDLGGAAGGIGSSSSTRAGHDAISTSMPGAIWGAEISSYSRVTSNMGLFPALGSSPGSNAGTTGGAGSAHSPPTGGGVWGGAAQSPPTVGGVWGGTAQSPPTSGGVWGGDGSPAGSTRASSIGSPSSTAHLTAGGDQRRKKQNGRSTILLSNAGAPHRR